MLDDFLPTDPINPLAEVADIIKVDFFNTSYDERRAIVEKAGNGKVKFLAERIETKEDYEEAVSLGYTYFQGYYFSKPEVID